MSNSKQNKSVAEKELEFVFPEEEVEIAGQTFTIRPFSFYETLTVAEKLYPMFNLIGSNGKLDTQALTKELHQSAENIIDIIALSLNLNKNTVKKFDNKNAVKAIAKIIEVNKDFFTEIEEEAAPILQLLQEPEEPTQEK